MSPDQAIYAWLQTIADAHVDAVERILKEYKPLQKRRRLNLPTPETSRSSSSMHSLDRDSSPEKRGYVDDANDQITPRAHNRRRIKAPRSESSYSLPSSRSQYQSSNYSGHSSPSKQLNELERNPRGVLPRELSSFHHKPPSLETLLDKIDLISAGQGILPTSERHVFDELDVSGETYCDWKWARRKVVSDMHFSDQRHELGATPPPDAVHRILYQAAFCNTNSSSEADWNTEVHHRVLEAALRPTNSVGAGQLVDFRSSTIASIIPDYHLTNLSHKKVDFCVYIEPTCDEEHTHASRTITSLSAAMPQGTFNHTNLSTLRNRPIAISIETKRTGEGWDNARLQMGVWNAAHWEFLRRLLRMKQHATNEPSRADQQQPAVDSQPEAMENTPQGGLGLEAQSSQLPEYLPGIIIQGHDWHLVITTRQGEKILLWQKVTFGSTSSSKGIYQIICTLQVLRQWVRDEYWPWLRTLVSEWPSHDGYPLIGS